MKFEHMKNDRVRSVPASIALDSKNPLDYHHVNNNLPSLERLAPICKERVYYLNTEVQVFIKVLFIYCIRFIELYNCRIDNYIEPDRFILFGAKSSGSTIIYLPGSSNIVNALSYENTPYLFPSITYKIVYSALKTINLDSSIMKERNMSALHYARKKIDTLTRGVLPDRVISDLLHHRSANSSIYYRSLDR